MQYEAICHKRLGWLCAPDGERASDGAKLVWRWEESKSGKTLRLVATTDDAAFYRVDLPAQVRASSVIAYA